MTGRRRLRRAVALSFPLAWALHDLEELLTAAAWGRTAPERIRRRFPNAPRRLVEATAVTTLQMAVAIGVVGAGVVGGAGSGLRDPDGDMGLLPAVLAAYTAHGATHLAQAAALRGYTPGVVTVPLVIAPYSVWAWRALRRSGLAAAGCAGTSPPALRSRWGWRSPATRRAGSSSASAPADPAERSRRCTEPRTGEPGRGSARR